MNRRQILTTATRAAVPMLILAASRPGFAQPGPVPTNAGTHKERTLQIGALSLQLSELALKRAQAPRVREFAGFEQDEQKTLAEVLTSQHDPQPVALDAMGKQALAQLTGATAAQFDAEYVALEIKGHTQLLEVQEDYLQTQSSISSDEVHIAMLARGVIRMHLAMLNDLKGTLKG